MGIRELRSLASQLKIKNYSKLNKPDLEAAVQAAQGNVACKPSANAQKIGEVDGRVVLVSQDDTAESVGVLLGTFSKGCARQVRKMLRASGFARFAGVPRMSGTNSAKEAA